MAPHGKPRSRGEHELLDAHIAALPDDREPSLDDKLGQELQVGLKRVSVASLKRSCSAIETQSVRELLCPKITHATYLEMILQRGHQYQMAPARPAEVTNQGATATPQLSGTSPGLHTKAQGSWLQAALMGERSWALK